MTQVKTKTHINALISKLISVKFDSFASRKNAAIYLAERFLKASDVGSSSSLLNTSPVSLVTNRRGGVSVNDKLCSNLFKIVPLAKLGI